MNYRGITVEDTYCECTDIYVSRVLLTALTETIALNEATYLCGWSIITAVPIQGCIEGVVAPSATPDGRPGVLIHLNAPTPVGLTSFREAVLERLYLFPHLPTCSLFNATPEGRAEHWIEPADYVGRWGDGFEHDAIVGGHDVLTIPIMTGDQVIGRKLGVCTGTDGVLEVFGVDVASCMEGAQAAVARIVGDLSLVAVFNYPVGGISGAKVGGKTYTEEGVTINEPFCPSLRDTVETKIPQDATAVIEFPMTAMSEASVRVGLKTAMDAFADTPGIVGLTAPSFGGAWGGRQLLLRDLLEGTG